MLKITFDLIFMYLVIGSFTILWLVLQTYKPLKSVKLESTRRFLSIVFYALTGLLFYVPAFVEKGFQDYGDNQIDPFSGTIYLIESHMRFGVWLLFLLTYLIIFFILLRVLVTQTVGTKSSYLLQFVSIFHFFTLIRYITYIVSPFTFRTQIIFFSDALYPDSITITYTPLLGFYIYALSVVVLMYITADTVLKQVKERLEHEQQPAKVLAEGMAKIL